MGNLTERFKDALSKLSPYEKEYLHLQVYILYLTKKGNRDNYNIFHDDSCNIFSITYFHDGMSCSGPTMLTEEGNRRLRENLLLFDRIKDLEAERDRLIFVNGCGIEEKPRQIIGMFSQNNEMFYNLCDLLGID